MKKNLVIPFALGAAAILAQFSKAEGTPNSLTLLGGSSGAVTLYQCSVDAEGSPDTCEASLRMSPEIFVERLAYGLSPTQNPLDRFTDFYQTRKKYFTPAEIRIVDSLLEEESEYDGLDKQQLAQLDKVLRNGLLKFGRALARTAASGQNTEVLPISRLEARLLNHYSCLGAIYLSQEQSPELTSCVSNNGGIFTRISNPAQTRAVAWLDTTTGLRWHTDFASVRSTAQAEAFCRATPGARLPSLAEIEASRASGAHRLFGAQFDILGDYGYTRDWDSKQGKPIGFNVTNFSSSSFDPDRIRNSPTAICVSK